MTRSQKRTWEIPWRSTIDIYPVELKTQEANPDCFPNDFE